jgi:hypothetical protein
MLEDLFNHFLIFDECDDSHLTLALGASQGINLPGSGPGQAPIF